jgi:hypothetical protein
MVRPSSASCKTRGRSGKTKRRNLTTGAENGTSPEVFTVRVADIRPAVLNDVVYGVINADDPSLDELARAMTAEGQLEPVVLTLDDVLLSGHRRRGVALRLGWETLKARRHPVYSTDPDFERLLVTFNAQRDKSPSVRVREQLVLIDPDSAYRSLVREREEESRVKAQALVLGAGRGRAAITAAKQPFLDAIRRVIDELEQYWPLSDRRIHYALLNDPPLIHARKPHSRYRNDHKSYKAVCELLTRARLEQIIPYEAIGDETRPVTTWRVYPNVGPFIRGQVDRFCSGYARDLMQDQPNHIEIVGEKLTVAGIVRPVAAKFCIPYTIGRGYASLPPARRCTTATRRAGRRSSSSCSWATTTPRAGTSPRRSPRVCATTSWWTTLWPSRWR